MYHQTNASVYINRETGQNWTAEFGTESVNLLYPSSIKEVKQRISQVSTGPNSPLNATSSASDNKDTISLPNMQEERVKFSLREPIFYSNAEYAVRGIKQEKAIALPQASLIKGRFGGIVYMSRRPTPATKKGET